MTTPRPEFAHARACQQRFVFRHKICAALLVDGVEPGAKEQPKRVREVVERQAGFIIMRLPNPHVGVQVALVQPFAVGSLLAALHDLAQLICRKFGLFAALKHFLLKQVA